MFGRRRLTPAQYVQTMRGGLRTRLAESDVVVAQVAIALVGNNPNRLAWEFVNNGVNRVDFTSNRTLTAGNARPLGPTGGFAEMNAQEDGEAVGYQQLAISAAGNNSVHVTELIADFQEVPDVQGPLSIRWPWDR
jgi:hypothetical protein